MEAVVLFPAGPRDVIVDGENLFETSRRLYERALSDPSALGEASFPTLDEVIRFVLHEEGYDPRDITLIPLGTRRLDHRCGHHPEDTEYCARLASLYAEREWGVRTEDPVILRKDPNRFEVFREIEDVLKALHRREDLKRSELYAYVGGAHPNVGWAIRLIGATLWEDRFHPLRALDGSVEVEPSPLILPMKTMKRVLVEHGLFEVAAGIAERFSAYEDRMEPVYLRARDSELNFNYGEARRLYAEVARSAHLDELRHNARRRLRKLKDAEKDPMRRIIHHMRVVLENARYQWIRGEFGDFIVRLSMLYENYTQACFMLLYERLSGERVTTSDPVKLAGLLADLLGSSEELSEAVEKRLDSDIEGVLKELRGEEGEGRAVLAFLHVAQKVLSAALEADVAEKNVFGPLSRYIRVLSCSELRKARHLFAHEGRGVSREDVERIAKAMAKPCRANFGTIDELLSFLEEGIDRLELAVSEVRGTGRGS
ncbi:hypothetical protein [Methanopyrus sp.]